VLLLSEIRLDERDPRLSLGYTVEVYGHRRTDLYFDLLRAGQTFSTVLFVKLPERKQDLHYCKTQFLNEFLHLIGCGITGVTFYCSTLGL
jgi:hypothetical protein